MPDWEKVIKGMEIIHNGCDGIKCCDCCYQIKEPAKPGRCGLDEEQIYQDALALLKEQQDEIYALQVEVASAKEYAEGCAELLKEQETELCDRCGRRRAKSNRVADRG